MDYAQALRALICRDEERWSVLAIVRDLELPDRWVGAGFVRNAVWEHLHGRERAPIVGDVDVLWYGADEVARYRDRELEDLAQRQRPHLRWSVKNQAHMHLRNSDRRYDSTSDAVALWPETATAVAVRRTAADECELIAPLGLADLFELRLKPGSRFLGEKLPIFEQRVADKQWLINFPLLQPSSS